MERNYKIDLYKAIASIVVLWIHIGTFVTQPDSIFLYYARGLSSLVVPLFFIISGYFIAMSKNPLPATMKLIKIYLVMALCTVIFDFLFLGNFSLSMTIKKVFYFNTYSVGYLWFIKLLIYYRVFILIIERTFKSEKINLIFAGACLVFALFFNVMLIPTIYVSLTFCSVGYLLAKFQVPNNIKINSTLVILFIMGLYLVTFNGYDTKSIYALISATLLFLTAFQGSLKNNPLVFYSRNSLNLLFLHYIVLTIFKQYNVFISGQYVINFILLLVGCTVILYLYEKSTEFIKRESKNS